MPTKDQSPQELDGDWDTVGASVIPVLCRVGDTTGEQNADSDGELIARYQSTTDLSWSNFGHVEDDDGGDETYAKSCNDSTDAHESNASGGSFADAADGEDKAAPNNSQAAANKISNITSNDGAKESSS